MKKILSALLVLVLVLSCFTVFTGVAADPEKVVYISDNGNDEKDGLTAENAVKTYQRAQEVLGETGGVIMITDIYTYPKSFADGKSSYYMPYVKGATYTIRGMKEDGSSVFAHLRGNIAMTNPITFDNLTYHIAGQTWSNLYACTNRLEFTETVKMRPYNDVNERNNYLFVYGGDTGKASTKEQPIELILNGGTFGYVVAGCHNSETHGKVSVTVGGTANIINRLYCGAAYKDTVTICAGDLDIRINGGTIGDYIYLGGVGADNYVDGNTTLTVTGGTFKGIICRGSGGGANTGNLTIDLTDYAPAKEAGWVEANILDANAKTTVITEKAPVTTEAPSTTSASSQLTSVSEREPSVKMAGTVLGRAKSSPTRRVTTALSRASA